MKPNQRVLRLATMAVVMLVAIVYYRTLSPTVVQIDSGELAAVQSTLGIAHPTGYPLFTLLGYLFLCIPLSHSKIFQLNFLSLVYCVLGILFFIKSTHVILVHFVSPSFSTIAKHSRPKKNATSTNNEKADMPFSRLISSIIGALFLSFGRTFWLQSTSTEVYSLHACLIIAAIYFLFKTFTNETLSNKCWMWVGVAVALAFSNHMTTIFILPGAAYLFFKKEGFRPSSIRPLLTTAGIFTAIICLVYLYLPIRSAQNPTLNWGNPSDWERIIRHVTGKQYSVWLFSSSHVALKNLTRFFQNLPGEFTVIGLLVGLVGFVFTLWKAPRLCIFLSITFSFTVIYAINYDIHDLDTYFLLAYIVLAVWITVGVHGLLSFFKKTRWRAVLLGMLPICVLVEAIAHSSEADRSNLYVFEDYTKQALESLPKNAILLTYQWDCLISPSYYFQFVEDYRRDVVIIDKELLRRSWYYDQLSNICPDVMRKIRPEVESFLAALAPFERGGDYDALLLESRYRTVIARIIQTNIGNRTVFLGPELVEGELRRGEIILPVNVRLIPDLFFFRAIASTDYIPSESINIDIRFPSKDNQYSDAIKNYVSRMLVWRALYELQSGKIENAKILKGTIKIQFPCLQLPVSLKEL